MYQYKNADEVLGINLQFQLPNLLHQPSLSQLLLQKSQRLHRQLRFLPLPCQKCLLHPQNPPLLPHWIPQPPPRFLHLQMLLLLPQSLLMLPLHRQLLQSQLLQLSTLQPQLLLPKPLLLPCIRF